MVALAPTALTLAVTTIVVMGTSDAVRVILVLAASAGALVLGTLVLVTIVQITELLGMQSGRTEKSMVDALVGSNINISVMGFVGHSQLIDRDASFLVEDKSLGI